MEFHWTKEECIKDLEMMVEKLQYNITLLRNGYRPCSDEWRAVQEPFQSCINYLMNPHDELIDTASVEPSSIKVEDYAEFSDWAAMQTREMLKNS